MNDKSWMLNPQAIRYAKVCIQIIKDRLNIKLKLSQADFFQQLEECGNKIRSFELIAAHHQLMAIAEASGIEVINSDANVVPIFNRNANRAPRAVDSVVTKTKEDKTFPNWSQTKAARGVYRGQPTYQ